MNANEHYVSQVLLRRFTAAGHLQCYQVQTDKWKRVSPKNVFSDFGYNQLLIYGQIDNTLEQAFSKVETPLPKTFAALEEAVNKPSTELPLAVYENLCWYCAFIKRLSPFAKAAAPADFIIQLDMELENGRDDTLREVLKFPEEVIQFYRREHVLGRKVKAIDAIHFGRYGEALTNFDYVLTIDPTADTSRALAVACAIEIGNMPKAQQLNTNYAIGDGRWKQWADGKMMLATNAIQQGTEKYVSLAKKYPTFMNSAFIAQGNHILRKIDWVTYSKLMQVTNNTASSNSK